MACIMEETPGESSAYHHKNGRGECHVFLSSVLKIRLVLHISDGFVHPTAKHNAIQVCISSFQEYLQIASAE